MSPKSTPDAGSCYVSVMKKPPDGLASLLPLLVPVFALVLARPSRARAAEPAPLTYPPTRTTQTSDVVHGVDVRDPYRWLEDEKNPEVQAWMTAQDGLARRRLAGLPGRDALAARLKELLYLDSLGAPIHRGTRYFFTRRHANKEKSIVCWKEGVDGAEQVLLDPNGWSADGSASLGVWRVSWDGERVAYGKKVNNSDEATLYVMDVKTGKVSDVDVIEGAKYAGPSWTPDGSAFYYTKLPVDPKIPASERPGWQDVRLHRLGTDPKTDTVVKEKLGDPTTFQNVHITRDGRFLFLVVSHGWTSTDVWFRDLGKAAAGDAWTPLAVGIKAHFNPDSFGGTLFVQTDDGAPKGRIFAVDPAKPGRAAWKEIVPERRDAALQSFDVVGGKLALDYLRSASGLVEVRNLDGTLVREVPLPGIGSVGSLVGRDDEDEAFFSFTSFTTPTSIYRTSVKTGATSLYFQVKVPADPAPYTVEPGVLSLQGRHAGLDVHRPPQGSQARRLGPRDPRGLRRLPRLGDARLPGVALPVARARRHLRGPEPAGRRRVRGGVARGRDAPQEAERLRRLRGGGGVPREGEVDVGRPPRPARRLERGAPPRRHGRAAPRALPRRALRGAAPRHGALPPLRCRQDVDLRVRLGGRRRAIQGSATRTRRTTA